MLRALFLEYRDRVRYWNWHFKKTIDQDILDWQRRYGWDQENSQPGGRFP